MKTAIEMAREIFADALRHNAVRAGKISDILSGNDNSLGGTAAIEAILAMHSAQQAVIDELVDCLAKAFADPERLLNSESAMNETGALLAKYGKEAK